MANTTEIQAQVRKHILDDFMFTDDESALANDISLFDNGIVDSTGALELVSFIEETFSVKVEDIELVPDNFDSVDRLVTYIQQKLSAGA